jgi:deoxycytidine triphosphate deaminase
MDLHLADTIALERDTLLSPPFSVCLVDAHEQDSMDNIITSIVMGADGVWLPPRTRFLAATLEEVECPADCCGLTVMRSTYARLGLMMQQAWIDPGYRGTLTFGMFNASLHRIKLEKADSLWSVKWLKLGRDEAPYTGRYQGSKGLQLPRALKRGECCYRSVTTVATLKPQSTSASCASGSTAPSMGLATGTRCPAHHSRNC